MQSDTRQVNPLAYDLALRLKGQGFALTIRNRGVTLSDERLDWTFDGRADAARLDSIAQVHLQTGGAWMEEGLIAMCRITFRDGRTLSVSDVDQAGLKDDARAGTYCAFVRDLHGRLARLDSTARFTAGYGEVQFRVIAICAALLGAIGIGIPLVALLFRPNLEILLMLGGGIALTVPLFTMLMKNAPRSYDLRHFPIELLP